MATQAERLAVVETKVQNIEDKVDDLKVDVRDLHDCLDRTRDEIDKKLDAMLGEYRDNRDRYYDKAEEIAKMNQGQHAAIAEKISNLEKSKLRFQTYGMLVFAFLAGAGWLGHVDAKVLLRFVGL